ncbi:MAG: helix-turn-helix transcriptional regulator [Clostridia bacterium]|nr:helix-turn-helix transcriptional regulator [Clostridia bacterium]
MKIHESLRELRLSRNLTQEQVAEKLNVTRQTISSFETGRTRPDIDTLIKYCEIFGIELDSLIYGCDKELKANRRIKIIAVALFALLAALALTASLLFLSAQLFFSLPEGGMPEELMPLWQAHWKLIDIWKVLDSCLNFLSFAGFAALLLLLVSGKGRISLKVKLVYCALLSAVLILIPVICGLIDPRFSAQEYILTEAIVTIRLWAYLGLEEFLLYIKKRRK